MGDKMKRSENILKENHEMLLNYLKANYPMFHNSNFFFRDLQFGIKGFLEKKGFNIGNAEAEILAKDYSRFLEDQKIFIRINPQSWRVNYPEFVTQVPGDPL